MLAILPRQLPLPERLWVNGMSGASGDAQIQELAQREVDKFIAPSSMTIESIGALLVCYDTDSVSSLLRHDADDWVTFTTTRVSKVEYMFDAKYGMYGHASIGETITHDHRPYDQI